MRLRVAREVAEPLVELRKRNLASENVSTLSARGLRGPCARRLSARRQRDNRASHARTRPLPAPAAAGPRVGADPRRRRSVVDFPLATGTGSPAQCRCCRTRSCSALHEIGLRVARDRMDAALPDRVDARGARRRDAALREGAQLRRIRLRLGAGPTPIAATAGATTRSSSPRFRSRRRRVRASWRPMPARDARCSSVRCSAVRRDGYSSLHVLFTDARTRRAKCAAAGMLERQGVQFHWRNAGYRDFADFLSAFNHDKRKKMTPGAAPARPSRRHVHAQAGPRDHRADWAFFFGATSAPIAAHHSTPYLSLEFFERIGADAARQSAAGARAARRSAAVRCARRLRRGHAVGPLLGNARVRSRPALRGLLLPGDRVLHRARHRAASKAARRASTSSRAGFFPSPTRSLHAIADPDFAHAIADFCARERVDVAHSIDELETSTPFRRSPQ